MAGVDLQSSTDALCRYIVEPPPGGLDDSVLEAAIAPIVDTVGVMLAGLGSEPGAALAAYAARQASSGTAGAWVPLAGAGIGPEAAALVNGTLAHSLDYDDTVLGAGHPSGVVLAAVLAACDPGLDGRRPLTGRELLEAYAVGFDVHVKMARALGLKHYKHGWHTTGTAGAFAATASIARAMGMTERETAVALGMTASTIGGIQRNFGTGTKPLHSGLAARAAVTATTLTTLGLTAATDAFDGSRSLLDVYGLGEADPGQFALLGDPHALVDPGVALKKYPACFTTHRAIEATLRLRAAHELGPDDVRSIHCAAPTNAFMYLMKHPPRTGLEGKFSVEYLIAAALVDGAIGLETFSDDAVKRPEIADLLGRIDAREELRCRPEDPEGLRSSPATGGFIEVRVETRHGGEHVEQVTAPEGSTEHPMSWDSLKAKFLDCARFGAVDGGAAEAAFDALRDLPAVADVHAVLRPLAA